MEREQSVLLNPFKMESDEEINLSNQCFNLQEQQLG